MLEGVPDVQAESSFVLPPEAFAHTDHGAVIRLEARQSHGEPLPAWMKFNHADGTFSGTPPEGRPVPVEVQVLAKDNQQREASVIFKLELGVTAAASTAGAGAVLGSDDLGFPVARVGPDSSAEAQVAPTSGDGVLAAGVTFRSRTGAEWRACCLSPSFSSPRSLRR